MEQGIDFPLIASLDGALQIAFVAAFGIIAGLLLGDVVFVLRAGGAAPRRRRTDARCRRRRSPATICRVRASATAPISRGEWRHRGWSAQKPTVRRQGVFALLPARSHCAARSVSFEAWRRFALAGYQQSRTGKVVRRALPGGRELLGDVKRIAAQLVIKQTRHDEQIESERTGRPVSSCPWSAAWMMAT